MFDLFPDIRAVLQRARLDLVRRPIADGGGRARPDGEAAAAAAGRAVAGARAGHRAGGVPDHLGDPAQHHGLACRAECAHGTFGRRSRLRAGNRPHRARRQARRIVGQRSHRAPPISAVTPRSAPERRRATSNPMVTIQVRRTSSISLRRRFRPCGILAGGGQAHRDLSDDRQSHRP